MFYIDFENKDDQCDGFDDPDNICPKKAECYVMLPNANASWSGELTEGHLCPYHLLDNIKAFVGSKVEVIQSRYIK